MDVIETLRYLNSADGPNIPLRTLGAYCGITHGMLSSYLRGERKPLPETRKQLEKGTKEMIMEIIGECRWLL
jgi:transcriptional regulator with XRE-family HTH domain